MTKTRRRLQFFERTVSKYTMPDDDEIMLIDDFMDSFKCFVVLLESDSVNSHFVLDKSIALIEECQNKVNEFDKLGKRRKDEWGFRAYFLDFQKEYSTRVHGFIRSWPIIMASFCSKRYTKLSEDQLTSVGFWETVRKTVKDSVPWTPVYQIEEPPAKKSRTTSKKNLL